MVAQLIQQLKTVPEYLFALKGAVAILASGLPIYLGLRYFLYRRKMKLPFSATLQFVSVFFLFAGLAFLLASPLATLLPGAAITAYLFVTCLAASFGVVSLVDVFVLQHYLSDVKKLYISPPLRAAIKLIVFCVALLPILRFVLHFNPLALVAIPTIATAGIALALQDTLKTFIASVGLGKIIRMGEWIGFQGQDGQVVDINWARTVIKKTDGNYVFIPNSQLQNGLFLNYSTVSASNRVVFKVGASYDAPPDRVKEVLLTAVSDIAGMVKDPAPWVAVQEYGDSAIQYGLHFWVDDFGQVGAVQDEVATRIWYAFRRESIEIPYPTRTVQVMKRRTTAGGDKAVIEENLHHWTLAAAFYAEELHELSLHTQQRSFARGERILQEGDPGETLFLILKGSVGVYKGTSTDEPVAVLHERDIFGEMSLLTGAPRSATIRAQGHVEVLEIDKAGLQRVMARRPELSETLAHLITQRQSTVAAIPHASASPEEIEAPTLAHRIRDFFGL